MFECVYNQDIIANICRICLENVTEYIDLFSDEIDSKDILNKIYLCSNVTLICEGNLPRSICRTCISELDKANNFREMCITITTRFMAKYNPSLVASSQFDNNNDVSPEYEDSDTIAASHSTNFKPCNDKKEDKCTLSTEPINEDSTTLEFHKCKICDKSLKTRTSLLRHNILMHEKRKHVGKVTGFGGSRKYNCISCSYSTPHSQTLVNHMRRHDGERPYQCECGKSFTQASSLNAHFKTHSSTTNYTCTVCGKQFKHAFTLKNHAKVHENPNISCSICQKILKTKQSLQAHTKRHFSIHNYNCEDCGDTFVTSGELIHHRQKHSNQKKFECHLCGYKTNTKKNLVVHLNRHTGNKSFICELCQAAFYTRVDLRRHRRVHTREKPFSCPTCTQRFTHSTSLNKHMSTVHGVHYKWGDVKKKELKRLQLAT